MVLVLRDSPVNNFFLKNGVDPTFKTLLPPLSLLPPLLQRAAATGKVGARAHMKVAAAVAELKLTRVAGVVGPTVAETQALLLPDTCGEGSVSRSSPCLKWRGSG